MKKIISIAIKANGKFRLQNMFSFRNLIKDIPDGKYKITIEKNYNKASVSQFGWLYASVYPLSMIALNDSGYEFTNIDQVDTFWKSLFANTELLNRETGEVMILPKSKADFVTIDQMAYCNKIRDYCSEYLGAYIPEPIKQTKNNQDGI